METNTLEFAQSPLTSRFEETFERPAFIAIEAQQNDESEWSSQSLFDCMKHDGLFIALSYLFFLSRQRTTKAATSLTAVIWLVVGGGFISVALLSFVVTVIYMAWLGRASPKGTLFEVIFGFGAVLQAVVGFAALFLGYQRVNSKCKCVELQHYPRAIRLATVFILLLTLLSVVSGCLRFGSDFEGLLYYVLTFCFVVMDAVVGGGAVGISLMFLLVDTRTSVASLENLFAQTEKELLTMEAVVAARIETRRRLDYSYSLNTAMAFSALVNTTAFILAIFSYSSEFSNPGVIILAVPWYLKEVTYLFIALNEIAKVNETSDRLVRLVGRERWTDDKEFRRLQAYVNLQSNRISFTLLGTVPKRWTVFLQFVSFCVALAVSIVRSIVIAAT